MLMNVICWILLGLASGFLTSKVVNEHGKDVVLDIVLGLTGGLIGGWLFNGFGSVGVMAFNVGSLFFAIAGAVVMLVLWNGVRDAIRF
jgi:uncharacterized membrane protein YeaQ/YmgE (transglycosylase-associated protein family)